MSWVIVLFKAPKSSDDTNSDGDKFLNHLRRLEEENGQLVSKVGVVPVLDFEFTGLEVLWRLLSEGDKYDGLILTSPRCVESLRRCIQFQMSNGTQPEYWDVNLKVKWASKRIFCVGQATLACALQFFDVANSVVSPSNVICSEVGTSEDLAKVILEEIAKDPIVLPLLYPSGNLKTETLSNILNANGVPFHHILTYRTIENPKMVHILRSIVTRREGEEDGVEWDRMLCIFFSPSGINFAIPHLDQLDKKQFIAIGPTTRAALERVNGIDPLKIFQCSNPTPEALTQLVLEILQRQEP